MKQNNHLNVFYKGKIVGKLAMNTEKKYCLNMMSHGSGMVFLLVHFLCR